MLHIRRILALTMLALVATLFHAGQATLAVVCLFISLATLSPVNLPQLGAAPDTLVISSSLKLDAFLGSAIQAFKRAAIKLRMFSTVFSNVQLQGTDIIQVPYVPLQGITSADFVAASGYLFAAGAGGSIGTRPVTVNKRKYQPLTFTSSELARQPYLSIEEIAALKGEKLAYDMIQDVLSLVTAANYPLVAHTGVAGNFDSDDVADIRGGCNLGYTGVLSVTDGVTATNTTLTSATALFNDNDIGTTVSGSGIPVGAYITAVASATSVTLSAATTATASGVTVTLGRNKLPWPEVGRGLLLTPDYDTNLFKDASVGDASQYGAANVIQEGRLPRIMGFDYAQSAAIPSNGENLTGLVTYKSSILIACSPVPPADNGNIVDYRTVTDEDSGITLEYRKWFEPQMDAVREVIEVNYGYGKGEQLALKRIKSS